MTKDMSRETYFPPTLRVIEITGISIICESLGFEKYNHDGDY